MLRAGSGVLVEVRDRGGKVQGITRGIVFNLRELLNLAGASSFWSAKLRTKVSKVADQNEQFADQSEPFADQNELGLILVREFADQNELSRTKMSLHKSLNHRERCGSTNYPDSSSNIRWDN